MAIGTSVGDILSHPYMHPTLTLKETSLRLPHGTSGSPSIGEARGERSLLGDVNLVVSAIFSVILEVDIRVASLMTLYTSTASALYGVTLVSP